MKRPSTTYDADHGLLRAEQFQIAYATNDIERACKVFQDSYGIKSFRQLQGPLPAGGHIHVELAWVGNTMYELITASGPGAELYVGQLPQTEFVIRHHHLGFLIHTEEEWRALFAQAKSKGHAVLSKSSNPGFMQSCFIESPTLAHYFEYLFPEPAGIAFLESVPHN